MEKVYKLYIKGHKPAEIAKLLDMEAMVVSRMLTSIPREIRIANFNMINKRLSKGWERWNEYILSPDRYTFFKMANNGLWVAYTPIINNQDGKEYKRLGKHYLSQAEKELRIVKYKKYDSKQEDKDSTRAVRNSFREIRNRR